MITERYTKKICGTCALLRFHQTRRAINTDNQAACYLWIERTAMARFLYPKNASQPGNYFVRRWIGWFIEIDNTGPSVFVNKCSSEAHVGERT